jgi:hypothetical protein
MAYPPSYPTLATDAIVDRVRRGRVNPDAVTN